MNGTVFHIRYIKATYNKFNRKEGENVMEEKVLTESEFMEQLDAYIVETEGVDAEKFEINKDEFKDMLDIMREKSAKLSRPDNFTSFSEIIKDFEDDEVHNAKDSVIVVFKDRFLFLLGMFKTSIMQVA